MNRRDFEDEYNPSSRAKRQKIEEANSQALEIDRISELPDSILVHILSLLPDTESVVRTSILSRRWKFLWTSVGVLNFCFNHGSPSNFIYFVNRTLMNCRHYNLKKLTVDVGRDRGGNSFPWLKAWIHHAVGCDLEELDITVRYLWEYDQEDYPVFKVPNHLFTNSSLTNLKFRECVLAPKEEISWKILQKLSIWHSDLSHDLIQSILLGCPVLEFLELGDCYGSDSLDVNSGSLKELVLDGCKFSNYQTGSIDISGPNILSLDIKGNWAVHKLVLLLHGLPSLVKVKLDFYSEDYSFIVDPDTRIGIFENINHVQELSVGQSAIEALSSLELDGQPSPLSKRTCLDMSFIKRRFFPALANLLQSSPCLERLLISNSSEYRGWTGNYTRRNYLTHQNRSFDCMRQCLKFVKICYSIEDDEHGECELGRFILENASVLEKMRIIIVASWNKRSSSEYQRILLQESRKYLSFPRASKEAVVLVEGDFDA